MARISKLNLPNNEIYDIYGQNVKTLDWDDYTDLPSAQKNSDTAFFVPDAPSGITLIPQTVPNLPANIASFSDGADNEPLAKLEVGIEAVQSGSGEPSPSNVRPILGKSTVNILNLDLPNGNYTANDRQISFAWKDGDTEYDMPFNVMANETVKDSSDNDVDVLTLESEYVLPFDIVYDAPEAIYASANDLSAGDYYFKIVNDSWGGNNGKYVSFTIDTILTAGKQIRKSSGAYNASIEDCTLAIYDSGASTNGTALAFTVSTTQPSSGTDLGQTDGTADLNYWHCVVLGYNRWKHSAIRQFLNSDQAKGNWWVQQHKWDVMPAYATTADGFLKGMDPAVLAHIKTTEVKTARNTVFNSGDTPLGGFDTTFDKIFLAALEQMYIQPQESGEGTYWPYYKELLNVNSPVARNATYPELKKYDLAAKTTSRTRWLRSCNRGNAYDAWYVYSSGGVNLDGAYGARRCAPCLRIAINDKKSISWSEAGTVYGGELDVINGVIHPYKYYSSYNGETLVGEWLSSMDVYAEGTTPTIGAQVVDFGAYDTDITIQPTQVSSILGNNNIWADSGQIKDCTYYKYGQGTKPQLYFNDTVYEGSEVIANPEDATPYTKLDTVYINGITYDINLHGQSHLVDKLYEASDGDGAPLNTDISYLNSHTLSEYDYITVCLCDPTTFAQDKLTQVNSFTSQSLLISDIVTPVTLSTINSGYCCVTFSDNQFNVSAHGADVSTNAPSIYSIYGVMGSGNKVEGNPEGTASETLEKIKIDDIIYDVPDVSITPSTIEEPKQKIADFEIDGASGSLYAPIVEIEGHASGTIASFTDGGNNKPLKTLKVAINPVQNLHGYDAPWVGGAGKNKLQVIATSQTIAGVTVTVKDDGTFIVNGTATQNISLLLSRKSVNGTPLPEGQLTMAGCPSGGSTSSYYLTCWRTNSGNSNDVGNGATFAYQSDWDFVVSLVITSGTACNNLTFKPMIRLSSVTDATFAPYSNICPISGWSAVNVYRTDINQWDEEWEVGAISNSNGANYELAERVRSKNYISVKPNTPYYLYLPNTYSSARIACYDKDRTYLGQATGWLSVNNNTAFTTPSNTFYIRFVVVKTDETYNNDISINYPSTDTEYHAYNGTTYTIDLNGTRYGGTLDVVSGELVVDRVSVDLGSLSWIYESTSNRFYTNGVASLIKLPGDSNTPNMICSQYLCVSYNYGTLNQNNSLFVGTPSGRLYVKDSRYTSASDFKTAMNGVQLVYELATPLTIQLTPTQITTLLGNNNIWSDTGDIDEVIYIRDLNLALNELWDLVHSNSGTRSLSLSKSAVKEESKKEPKEEEETKEEQR